MKETIYDIFNNKEYNEIRNRITDIYKKKCADGHDPEKVNLALLKLVEVGVYAGELDHILGDGA